jgi:hypothetical protein
VVLADFSQGSEPVLFSVATTFLHFPGDRGANKVKGLTSIEGNPVHAGEDFVAA